MAGDGSAPAIGMDDSFFNGSNQRPNQPMPAGSRVDVAADSSHDSTRGAINDHRAAVQAAAFHNSGGYYTGADGAGLVQGLD
jgi:hypothetical protein